MGGFRITAIASLAFLLVFACSCSPRGGSDAPEPSSLPGGVAECPDEDDSPHPTEDDPAMNRTTLGAFLDDLARDVDEGRADKSYSRHLVNEDGSSALPFDLADAAVSSPIPSYKVSSEGVPESFHLVRAPLFVGGEIAGFVLYETSSDGSATYIGIGELCAEQVNDFFQKHGDVALVYDSAGAWMVSGDAYERVDAEIMDWLYPVNTGNGTVGMSLAPYEFSECVSVAEADLSAVAGTDLSYRREIVPSSYECPDERRVTVPFPRIDMPAAKPVIYLYPEESCEVEVGLALDGTIETVYPAFTEERSSSEGCWRVQANPDGTLRDLASGREYGYLFWEGRSTEAPDFSQGFCVAGADTAPFLEGALHDLGLTDKEADDFITYWLPQMQANPYNLIAFQGESYERAAQLTVSPQPDTTIRVFMAWSPLDAAVQVEPQVLRAPVREGFTVVEWGGGEVPLP